MSKNIFSISGRIVDAARFAANVLLQQAVHAIESGNDIAALQFLHAGSEALTWDLPFAEAWLEQRARLAQPISKDTKIPDYLPPGVGD